MESDDTRASAPFPRGTLWSSIVERTRRAQARGALQPFATRTRIVEDHGVRFQVRAVTSLAGRPRTSGTARAGNPFLPYEEDLHVAEVCATHRCLLNKYPVIRHHVLIVTRRFEPQESALNLGDFAALSRAMAEYEALGFYNAGPVAGASQPHKHMQLVPLPLAAGEAAVPIETWFEDLPRRVELVRVPRMRFRHAFTWLDPGRDRLAERAAHTHELYRAMLVDSGLAPAAPGPYNLLVTRRYMLLVPRVRERYEAVAVNALGFAGSFFVPTKGAQDVISRTGPVAVLRQVALPA